MTSRLQKASSISVTALFIVFGAAMLALLLPTGWKLFSVQSGSMEPALSTGDLVLVDSVPAPEYRVGDVITYADPDNPKQTITHRVADIREGQQRVFVTQGDANARTDRPFNQAMVVGRQEVAIPYAGHMIDFLLTVPGLLLMIWLPALWIIVGETKRLTDYYRRMQKYIVPGFTPQIIRPSYGHSQKPVAIAAISISLMAMAGLSGTVLAAVSSMATLTGNTISVAGDGEPDTTCNNSSNVSVSSNTNQSSSSGNAESSGNTNGGSATSGNASNSSSTSVNVNINNTCPQP